MIAQNPSGRVSSSVPARDSEPLQAAREDFDSVSRAAHPVRLDGRSFSGVPNRDLELEELRSWLLHPRCSSRTRDAVWAYLVRRSRTEGAVFTAVCVGMALPMLTRLARRLSRRFADDPSDLHAAVLAGFVAELAVIDLDLPEIAVRLRWAAYRAGRRALSEALDAPRPASHFFGPREPRDPSAHPDLVLARAVAAGVLSEREAGLISTTRLGEETVTEAARRAGVGYKTLHQTRRRAEARLAAWLAQTGTTHPTRRLQTVRNRRSSAEPQKISGSGCRKNARKSEFLSERNF